MLPFPLIWRMEKTITKSIWCSHRDNMGILKGFSLHKTRLMSAHYMVRTCVPKQETMASEVMSKQHMSNEEYRHSKQEYRHSPQTHMHVHVHTHTHVCSHVCIDTHICSHTGMHAHTQTHIHTHTYWSTHTNTHMHTLVCICIQAYTYINACTHSYIHNHLHAACIDTSSHPQTFPIIVFGVMTPGLGYTVGKYFIELLKNRKMWV